MASIYRVTFLFGSTHSFKKVLACFEIQNSLSKVKKCQNMVLVSVDAIRYIIF